ncbi:hypothetical protein V1279_003386 [Bradyrhizobium sp. AZCC 1610]|uniref:hypothetical protein n=1 Tax=Bradyrhizobium sp. AZCC 1610 TaxID=3117020 RepID=UPI002FF40874
MLSLMSALRVNSGTLAGSLQNLIFKRNAFRVVFLKPFFRGVRGGEDLQVILIANLLARADKSRLGSCQECQPHFLADNLSDLNAAQGLYAVSYQIQELSPLYRFNLTTFHIDENESRHLVGDF